MKIIIQPQGTLAIYEQIVNQLKNAIVTKELKAGEALPSIRSLATDLGVSVITTKRAYEDLERDGFIESYTGKGSFVKGQNTELLREENLRQIEQLLVEASEKAKVTGVELDELKEILEIVYNGK